MAREGFYAVARGRREGVFSSWAEAEALVKGFRGAVFKKLSSHAEAQAFVAVQRSRPLTPVAVAGGGELPAPKRMQSQQPSAFYAVAAGHDTGVVTSWPQVLALTNGFTQPVFRKFASREAAEAFLAGYAAQLTKPRTSSGTASGALSTTRAAVSSNVAPAFECSDSADRTTNAAPIDSVSEPTHNESHQLEPGNPSPALPTRFWYAVARGRQTGVFDTWGEAKKHVEGLFSASFKKFPSREAAEAFVRQRQESADPDPEHPGTLVAFCDGSALQNGQRGCQAGFACVFPHCPSWNVATKLVEPRATNNRAEYFAALEAMKRANVEDAAQSRVLFIFSDSMLLIRSMTEWIGTWRRNHWCKADGVPVLNRDILEQLVAAQGVRRIVWRHVKAHTGRKDWRSKWNDAADRAARAAAGS
ncbi:hypothetical protein PybrP1_010428 [[Pythium] brassicae (nom. inval.)]|nr:hypothetical protein PybrP1_010428 [[Pythium] brassicae (nom. inval.)]